MKNRFVVRSWIRDADKHVFYGVYDIEGQGWLGGAIKFVTQSRAQASAQDWEKRRDPTYLGSDMRRVWLVKNPMDDSATKYYVDLHD